MSEQTVTVDPQLAQHLLDDALTADAATGPGADPPPRVPWLNEDGTPRWGLKADGSPRRSKPGPGAPRRSQNEQPRTTDRQPDPPPPPPPAAAAAEVPDYTTVFRDAGLTVWMALSSVPPAGGHAFLLHQQIPALATGLNGGARKNPWLQKQAAKLEAGEGWLWLIPLTVPIVSLAMGSWQLLRDGQTRRELAARNEVLFQDFVMEQMKAAGLDVDEPQPPQETPGSPAGPAQPTGTP